VVFREKGTLEGFGEVQRVVQSSCLLSENNTRFLWWRRSCVKVKQSCQWRVLNSSSNQWLMG
jgi:hypothetical protein